MDTKVKLSLMLGQQRSFTDKQSRASKAIQVVGWCSLMIFGKGLSLSMRIRDGLHLYIYILKWMMLLNEYHKGVDPQSRNYCVAHM
jgi:hypothetical protein